MVKKVALDSNGTLYFFQTPLKGSSQPDKVNIPGLTLGLSLADAN